MWLKRARCPDRKHWAVNERGRASRETKLAGTHYVVDRRIGSCSLPGALDPAIRQRSLGIDRSVQHILKYATT